MNELVNIQGTEISIKEFNGQRVVTFSDIDKVHGRPEGTARRNFSMNKERFKEGEHYFVVTPESLANSELYENRTNGIEVSSPRGKALITEKGYLLLVKSFTDDLAWEVQDRLIDSYFKVKNLASDLSPQMQMLYGMLDQMAQTERQAREAKEIAQKAAETAEAIKDAVTPVFDDWRKKTKDKVTKIAKKSDKSYQDIWDEMYRALERRAGCDLGTRLRNLRNRANDKGGKKTEIDKLCKLDVVESDKRLKEIFSKIVSEYEVKYCA